MARIVTTSPMCTGSRNDISSIETVTHRPPECLMAARAAAVSTSRMMAPPCTLPAMFASVTSISWEIVTADAEGGFGARTGSSLTGRILGADRFRYALVDDRSAAGVVSTRMRTGIEPASTRGPGRPRSPEADRAILEATVALLSEMGYQRLTIEEVAVRAGVSKTTIYRRHPSKISLVAAAATDFQDASVPELDTGSFRGDLLAIAGQAAGMLGSLWGRVLAGIVSEAANDPEVGRVLAAFFELRQARLRRDRGARRGARRDSPRH